MSRESWGWGLHKNKTDMKKYKLGCHGHFKSVRNTCDGLLALYKLIILVSSLKGFVFFWFILNYINTTD